MMMAYSAVDIEGGECRGVCMSTVSRCASAAPVVPVLAVVLVVCSW
jgi:hypothetical protein